MREYVLELVSQFLPGPFKRSGEYIVCKCPFHKGGNERTASFGVHLEKGVFNCFSCHESGDLRRLLRLLGTPREQVDSILDPIKKDLQRSKELYEQTKQHFFLDTDPFKATFVLPEDLPAIFDWMPVSLVEKGFDPKLLQDMEIGFDRKNNRIMYPIRDMYGALAGYSGGATLQDQIPKYKVYQGGHKKGSLWCPSDYGDWFDEKFPGYKFENHHFLWNFNRVFPRVIDVEEGNDTIFIVEGFKACLWMIQAGFINTIALMGSSISERQQRMLHRLGGDVVLCLDNDDAGRRATEKVGSVLWEPLHGKVFVMKYPKEHEFLKTQPDNYQPDVLYQMMQHAEQFVPKSALRGPQSISSETKKWE